MSRYLVFHAGYGDTTSLHTIPDLGLLTVSKEDLPRWVYDTHKWLEDEDLYDEEDNDIPPHKAIAICQVLETIDGVSVEEYVKVSVTSESSKQERGREYAEYLRLKAKFES